MRILQVHVAKVVEEFRGRFIQGRPFHLPADLASENAAMQGETYKLMTSRYDFFQGLTDELSATGYKAHVPLEVEFMGEKGQDLGGLCKEFLHLALSEV